MRCKHDKYNLNTGLWKCVRPNFKSSHLTSYKPCEDDSGCFEHSDEPMTTLENRIDVEYLHNTIASLKSEIQSIEDSLYTITLMCDRMSYLLPE